MKRKHKYLYDHGYPISKQYVDDVFLWDAKIKDDWPPIILIDGGMGTGKTTLAVQTSKLIEPNFNINLQIGVGGDNFLKAVDYCINNKKTCVIYDEAGDLSKMGALSKFNKKMMNFFETARQYKLHVILCLPCFFRLDNYLFDMDVVEFLVNISERNPNDTSFRVYDKYGISWLRYHAQKTVHKPEVYNKVSPLYRGHSLDLPKTEREALRCFSKKGKDSIRQRAIIEDRSIISLYDVAKRYGKSLTWSKLLIKKHRIKHTDIIGRKKYYPVGAFASIKDIKKPI